MKLRTQFLLGYIVVFTIMILVGGYMCLNVISLIDTHRWVEQSIEVRIRNNHDLLLTVFEKSVYYGYQYMFSIYAPSRLPYQAGFF